MYQGDLASRLTLNCTSLDCHGIRLEAEKITIIDSLVSARSSFFLSFLLLGFFCLLSFLLVSIGVDRWRVGAVVIAVVLAILGVHVVVVVVVVIPAPCCCCFRRHP